jgi:hypothetical protein
MEPIVLVHGGAGDIPDSRVPLKLTGVKKLRLWVTKFSKTVEAWWTPSKKLSNRWKTMRPSTLVKHWSAQPPQLIPLMCRLRFRPKFRTEMWKWTRLFMIGATLNSGP